MPAAPIEIADIRTRSGFRIAAGSQQRKRLSVMESLSLVSPAGSEGSDATVWHFLKEKAT